MLLNPRLWGEEEQMAYPLHVIYLARLWVYVFFYYYKLLGDETVILPIIFFPFSCDLIRGIESLPAVTVALSSAVV